MRALIERLEAGGVTEMVDEKMFDRARNLLNFMEKRDAAQTLIDSGMSAADARLAVSGAKVLIDFAEKRKKR